MKCNIRQRVNELSEDFKYSQEQEQEIAYFVNIHCELHGRNDTRNYESINSDFKKNRKLEYTQEQNYSAMDYIDYYFRKYFEDKKEYGVFVGRCMPFTNGHNAIIQNIIRDGKIPIMILGGKGKSDERHPLSFEDRVRIIKKVYTMDGIVFIGLEDKDNWTAWYDSVKQAFIDKGINKEQITLYAHNKEIDRKDFEYEGKHYKNEFYTKMFEENGVKIKVMEEVTCKLGHTIHASDVRKDEEVAKRNLDARVYRMLKYKYNWWK